MADIVLATINASYAHTAFGLRCLFANLGALQPLAAIREFTLEQRPLDIAEQILLEHPKIVGLGVYIWNATVVRELVDVLKAAAPELKIVLGGPEVSHEWEHNPLCHSADWVVTGEGEDAFRGLCERVLANEPPPERVIAGGLPSLAALQWAYPHYSDEDCARRVIYVEASRGCPFRCEFCLSALDEKVRPFPVDAFLVQMQQLLDRGVNQFKFVDRTFNLSLPVSTRILQFFLDHMRPGLFVHFEMIPDRLPEPLRALIRQFPPGSMQLEVGIQSFNPEVEARISRRQDHARIEDNLRFLALETGVHVHADLIAGLPGEDLASFASGFDKLRSFGVQEIQVGILKRLRGAPISRHTAEWKMVYNPQPPYQILSNALLDFGTLRCLERFARLWDIFANSGNFALTMGSLLGDAPSAFWRFWELSLWVVQRCGRVHAISLHRQFELLWEYGTQQLQRLPQDWAHTLYADMVRQGRVDPLPFLTAHVPMERVRQVRSEARAPKRQARHLAGG